MDEPETHFHSRLAVRFWDALESLSNSKRFVYVTHDLSFALSRRDAKIILVRPNQSPEIISPGTTLPADDVASILGAASFSVYASRLIFCEGREEKSLDQELLRAWFNDRETALIPVGGCENVKRCTAAFQTKSVVSGFFATGIIDRDHWPDDKLSNLTNVHVLPLHEIESLYVIKPVYTAIAVQAGHPLETVDNLYASVFDAFKKQMVGTLTNKLICERFKARSLMLIERAFSTKVEFADPAALKSTLVAEIPKTQPVVAPGNIWDEEEAIVNAALSSSEPTNFLKVLPGKPLIGLAATSLGLSKERYCELLKIGLGSSSDPSHKALEEALLPYLPPRKSSPTITVPATKIEP